MEWEFRWVSPNPERTSDIKFSSFDAAVDNAIFNARNARKRKNFYWIPPDKKQRVLVWRSMKKAGWRIRRKKVKED